jgi:hypothetical protein
VIHKTLAVVVELLQRFRLIKGELLSTDGQLEPSYSRYKGCPYAGEACHQFPVDEASRQELREQLHNGAKRLQLTCPFPEVVDKVREATAKKGHPKDPKVSLLEIEEVSGAAGWRSDRQQVATLLGLPADAVPPVHLTWCRLRQGPEGALWGSCPKVPSDLEATVGYHVDTQDPSKKEAVFGYVHLKTIDLNCELGLELPLGTSTYPADANEGTHFIEHRAALTMPVLPAQVQLGDAANDIIANYHWMHDQGGIAGLRSRRRPPPSASVRRKNISR